VRSAWLARQRTQRAGGHASITGCGALRRVRRFISPINLVTGGDLLLCSLNFSYRLNVPLLDSEGGAMGRK
jgi:hypothetical protein